MGSVWDSGGQEQSFATCLDSLTSVCGAINLERKEGLVARRGTQHCRCFFFSAPGTGPPTQVLQLIANSPLQLHFHLSMASLPVCPPLTKCHQTCSCLSLHLLSLVLVVFLSVRKYLSICQHFTLPSQSNCSPKKIHIYERDRIYMSLST